MYRLAYRNFGDHEALVVNHSVTAGTSTGVRWYELRNASGQTMASAAPIVFQQGTYAPDSTYRWMGSIAMDKARATSPLGYSVSSGSRYPSIAYASRAPGDALGTLQAETVVKTGAGSQTGEPVPLGRLQRDDRRPDRRLHVLVHERVPEGERHVQLEHADRVLQVPVLRRPADS